MNKILGSNARKSEANTTLTGISSQKKKRTKGEKPLKKKKNSAKKKEKLKKKSKIFDL